MKFRPRNTAHELDGIQHLKLISFLEDESLLRLE